MARKVPRHIQRLLVEDSRDLSVVHDRTGASFPYKNLDRVEQQSTKGRRIWPYVAGGAGLAAGGHVAQRLRAKPKAEQVAKGLVAAPVSKAFSGRDQNSSPSVTRLVARTPDGRFASHANDLKVVHVNVKHHPSSKLGVYGRGRGKRLT